MTPDEHFRRLERMYDSAPINRYFAPTLRVAEGQADITMTVRPDCFHAANALHGSGYFKALDDAAFFATNSVLTDVFVLTVTFNLVLLRPVTAGVMTARGRLAHRSRSLLVADSELSDAKGRIVARGSGTFMPSRVALGPEIGYA